MKIHLFFLLILAIYPVSADIISINNAGNREFIISGGTPDINGFFFGEIPTPSFVSAGGGGGPTLNITIPSANPKVCKLIKNYLKEYGNTSVYLLGYIESHKDNITEPYVIIDAYLRNYSKICKEKPLSIVDLISHPSKSFVYSFIAIFLMALIVFMAYVTRRRLAQQLNSGKPNIKG